MANADEEEMLLLLLLEQRQPRQREWVHDINMKREDLGEYHRLIQELRQDEERFHTYFRMSTSQFDHLVELLSPRIKKKLTNFRRPISVSERLAVTLRFLATGDSFTTVAYSFRMGVMTVAYIVEETCKAIWSVLVETYMPIPNEEKWKDIAGRFKRVWNFPNCIGAIDGKHICLQAPPNSGSLYFNYKGTFSIVLLALVDADYLFTYVDIGSYGCNSDGGIFKESELGKGLRDNTLHIPDDKALPNQEHSNLMPHVIVGDPAFPLNTYLMKPYPGKQLSDGQLVFNYRLSRARRVSENAFGLLTQRWRIYNRRINLHPEKAIHVVKASCVLHNYLQKPVRQVEGDPANLDDAGLAPLINDNPAAGLDHIQARHLGGNRAKAKAEECRNLFKNYFVSAEGEVYWQWNKIRRAAPE